MPSRRSARAYPEQNVTIQALYLLADALAASSHARGAPPPFASLARSRSLGPQALRSGISRTERRHGERLTRPHGTVCGCRHHAFTVETSSVAVAGTAPDIADSSAFWSRPSMMTTS